MTMKRRRNDACAAREGASNVAEGHEGACWQVGTLARDACFAREGTRGQVGTLARGTSSGGELASWHVGKGRCVDATQSRPYLRRILKPIKGKGFGVGIIIVRLILC